MPVYDASELGVLQAGFNKMVEGLRERERIREAFGTYVDRDVAEHILNEGPSTEGEEVEVTLMFLDVRDFTAFAESAPPQAVVSTLNRLFERAVPIVRKHGGHVDKFIGDGLLAVFGAPRPDPDHAEHALTAAQEIAKAVDKEFGDELAVGIGLNSGTVVAGSIGGSGRLEFSVIGDPVNVAARVEASTRETGDTILLSEAHQEPAPSAPSRKPRPEIELKGKSDGRPRLRPTLEAIWLGSPRMEASAEHATSTTRCRPRARALTAVALSATLHCLTGCAIGEVLGMVIGTALGFSDWGTVALAVALAFLFGYTLTSLPLLRAGLALGAVIPIALASDTAQHRDHGGRRQRDHARDPRRDGGGARRTRSSGAASRSRSSIAGAVALPVNRWLIARGKGHVAVHETGIHGGPSTRARRRRRRDRVRLRLGRPARSSCSRPSRPAPAPDLRVQVALVGETADRRRAPCRRRARRGPAATGSVSPAPSCVVVPSSATSIVTTASRRMMKPFGGCTDRT